MNTTITNNKTLLDYLNNYNNGIDDLASLSASTSQSSVQAVSEVESGLVNISTIDELVSKIQSGESDASSKTIADMLDFYRQQVSTEVEELADDMGLTSPPDFTFSDGQWQYLAAASNEAKTNNKAEQRFIDYLNKDSRLSDKMNKLQSLTQLNEINNAKANAKEIQNTDNQTASVENYLLETRQKINENSHFSFSEGRLTIAAKGIANQEYSGYQKSSQ